MSVKNFVFNCLSVETYIDKKIKCTVKKVTKALQVQLEGLRLNAQVARVVEDSDDSNEDYECAERNIEDEDWEDRYIEEEYIEQEDVDEEINEDIDEDISVRSLLAQ